ncbi:MAG: hypothetical protein ABIR48_07520 [Gammaproteobacteria bacterium]
MKPALNPRIEVIKNSFDVEDTVFHGLMALGVLKEIAIKAKGTNHQRWSAFMQRTGRFSEVAVEFAPWTKEELLEYAGMILDMTDPAHALYCYANEGIAALTDFSRRATMDYEHLINVGASINRPPYALIRI